MPGNRVPQEGIGKKGRTQAGRRTGVSSHTGSVRGESGGGPHCHRLQRSLNLSTGLCWWKALKGFRSTGQETSVSSLGERLS